ncbi:hypothetical protein LCGC14_1747310 [marine sediment metagenome]|uniref:Uncharacterized protein n=1 Tax=marine sediment metagenome TaxID=412755 RepID=A0A0F9JK41_9ZZZZ
MENILLNFIFGLILGFDMAIYSLWYKIVKLSPIKSQTKKV